MVNAQIFQHFKSQTTVVIADDYPVSISVVLITKLLCIKFPEVDMNSSSDELYANGVHVSAIF